MFYNKPNIKSLRRKLRKKQTEPEALLWQKLRNRAFENLKFYRQYSIGQYILDFYCPYLRFAIELDGSQHLEEEKQEYDDRRTDFLKNENIHLVRFYNTDVYEDLEGILEVIFDEVQNIIKFDK